MQDGNVIYSKLYKYFFKFIFIIYNLYNLKMSMRNIKVIKMHRHLLNYIHNPKYDRTNTKIYIQLI